MNSDELSDEHLLARSRAGCEDSFVVLYHRHQGRIFRFAMAMSGSTAAAEEVTQEVFLAVLNGEVRYDPDRGCVSSLLFGVARNHVLRLLRRDARYVEKLDSHDQPAGSSDTAGELDRRERIEAVRQAVLTLPPAYREVVSLCDLGEMDYEGAADVLCCPVGTVRSRLHRARALLTEKLRPAAAEARRMA